MNLRKISSKEEIISIMRLCSDDFFDQTINNDSKINQLAEKFYASAVVFVVSEGNTDAGFLAGYCNDSKIGYISMVIVRKEYQHKGYGSKLIKAMVEICQEKELEYLKLEVALNNIAAIQLYEKHGFSFEAAASDCTAYYIKHLKEM